MLRGLTSSLRNNDVETVPLALHACDGAAQLDCLLLKPSTDALVANPPSAVLFLNGNAQRFECLPPSVSPAARLCQRGGVSS